MKNRLHKNNLTLALALILIVALAVGGSLAYLSAETEKLENDFSFIDSDGGGDMQVSIDEPNWKGGLDLAPGDAVPKDPLLINTSGKDIDEWVALTVTIRKGENGTGDKLSRAEAALFDQYFEINFGLHGESPGTAGSKTWTKLGLTLMEAGESAYEGAYMYNARVPAGDKTEPLFTTVTYKSGADNAVADTIKNEWNGFSIILKGCAVQGPNVEWNELPAIWEQMIE